MRKALFILFSLMVVPMLHANAAPEPKMIRPTVKVEGVEGSRTPIFVKICFKAKNPDGGKVYSGCEEDTIYGNGTHRFHEIQADSFNFTARAQLNELCKRNCLVSKKFDHVPTGAIVLNF